MLFECQANLVTDSSWNYKNRRHLNDFRSEMEKINWCSSPTTATVDWSCKPEKHAAEWRNKKMNIFSIKTPSLSMCRRYGFDCGDSQMMMVQYYIFFMRWKIRWEWRNWENWGFVLGRWNIEHFSGVFGCLKKNHRKKSQGWIWESNFRMVIIPWHLKNRWTLKIEMLRRINWRLAGSVVSLWTQFTQACLQSIA